MRVLDGWKHFVGGTCGPHQTISGWVTALAAALPWDQSCIFNGELNFAGVGVDENVNNKMCVVTREIARVTRPIARVG